MKLIKGVILAGAMLASQISFGGNVLWTNATGDNRWSTPGNWRENAVPAASDVVYTSNTVAGAVIWVDVPIKVSSIRIEGTEDLTFYGEKITLSTYFSLPTVSGNTRNYHTAIAPFLAYVSGATVSNEVEMTSTGSAGVITARRDLTFVGKVSAPSATKFTHHNGLQDDTDGYPNPNPQPTLSFLGGFSAPNAVVAPTCYPNSFVRFTGKVEVKQLTTADWTNAKYALATDDISVENGIHDVYYTCTTYAEVANAFPSNTVFAPVAKGSGAATSANARSVNLLGHDQTIDRLSLGDATFADPATACANIRSTASASSETAVPATLTLRATASAVTPYAIIDAVSVVYDPMEAEFTQTFSNRVHATTGTLTVKGGAMCLKGETTFANVPLVSVMSGARLEVGTTGGPVFGDAAILDVKGTLRVAEGAQLFSTGKGEINVNSGKVILPANAKISIAQLKVKGVPQPVATYTAGDVGVDWLVGEGASVTVTQSFVGSYWAMPTDGTWGTAAAWLPEGVPTADANITANTKDFTVTVAADAGTVEGLTIVNADKTTTLSVAKSLTVTRPLLDIGRGAVVDVPEGGTLTYEPGTCATKDETTVQRVNIHDGGELRISGGTFETTKFNGGWDVQTGGKITISSGKLSFGMEGKTEAFNWESKSTGLRLYDGASLEMNGGVLAVDSEGWDLTPCFVLYGGSALFGGTAELQTDPQLKTGYMWLFGSGKARFENSASIRAASDSQKYLHLVATQSGVPLEIDFVDHTVFAGPQTVLLGANGSNLAGAKMRYASDQTSVVASNFMVLGFGFGDSELNLESGTIQLGGGGLHLGAWGVRNDTAKGTPHTASGTVNMTGGMIDIRNGGGVGDYINGLVVGDGSTVYNNEASLKSKFAGTLNISGGTITNSVGNWLSDPYLIVGIGAAEGTINQTGGTISFKPLNRWTTAPVFAVIGMGGAKGTWKMSGGTVELGNELYLGGCTTGAGGAFKHDVPVLSGHVYPGADKHDAVGLLSLSGGTFSVGKDLIVSEDGTGTLELKPGAKLTVGGNLDARTGSKLVVDARGYSGKSQTLATFGGTTRGFDDVDFKHDGNLRLSVTDTRIRLLGDRGIVFVVR